MSISDTNPSPRRFPFRGLHWRRRSGSETRPPDSTVVEDRNIAETRSLTRPSFLKSSMIMKPSKWFTSLKGHGRSMRSVSTDALNNHHDDVGTAQEEIVAEATSAQSSSQRPPSVGPENAKLFTPNDQSLTPATSDVVGASIEGAKAALATMRPLLGPVEATASSIIQVDDPIAAVDPVLTLVSALSQFNRIVDDIATVHPYVHAAWSILGSASKLIVNQANRDKSVQDLLLKMDKTYKLLNETEFEKIHSPAVKSALERMSKQTLECAYFIQTYAQDHEFRQRLLKHLFPNTDSRIQNYQQALDESLQAILNGAALTTSLTVQRIWDEVKDIQDLALGIDLNSMPYAGGAGLNLDKVCLQGTRKEILNEIMDWASNTDSSTPRLFWLHGNAGKGKSAIAHTIAHHFQELQRLGSCFCFDRNEAGQKRHQTIFTTIARDFADRDEHLRAELKHIVHQYSSLKNTTDVLQQWKEFIMKPAMKHGDVMAGPVVIVIDALDESGDSESRKSLLRILAGKVADSESRIQGLPSNFRFLVTSRLLPDINQAFLGVKHVRQRSMDDIQSTGSDITRYIKSELSALDFLEEDGVLDRLAISSNGLFEWARLACAYIINDNYGGLDRRERFELITSRSQEVGDHQVLDNMYCVTLDAIFPKSPNQGRILQRFHSVMAQLISTAEPFSLASLSFMRSHFYDPKLRDIPVKAIIEPMGALLSGTTGSSLVVRPLHASFIDFLTDKGRSGKFFVDLSLTNRELAFACLAIMEEGLIFNICNLPSSYIANSEVSDLTERIARNISAELSYACRFWTDHLRRATFAVSLADSVRAFFGHERLLFWLEVLSLLKKVNTCYAALSRVIEWVTPSSGPKNNVEDHKSSYEDIANDAADAQRFVRVFGGSISFSSPHLYVSALPFSPKHSRISQKFVQNFPNTLKIVQGQQKSWPATQAILRGHTNTVASVAFSPDGRRIVSGSWDMTIWIWDSETGEPVRPPLLGHENLVFSVAFSLDGKKIASGSSDGTVRLWDPETGETLLPPLKSHYDWVRSVAFSPDGKEIVSGSDDHTVHLWSTETGKQLHSPLEGHDGYISSASFSPDGRYIISGSGDRTVRLWDAENRQQLEPVLRGHSHSVNSVTVSPDGSLVASGSDDNMVCLWDVKTMRQLGEPLTGHTGSVYSVAFSPDGSRIISGSDDSTVRLWSVETRQQISLPLNGHEGSVSSVAFSPDGRRIVSGSYDNTLRIWDSESTEEELRAPRTGHKRLISSIAFSPDGKQIASASWDKTIRIWNAETGELLKSSLEGHEGDINSVAFSTDGKQLVSGSDDNTVRVWDVEKGEQLGQPLQGHDNYVLSVCFSPDGKLFASSSADETIRLWKTDTWEQLQPSLRGHGNWILSVAFAPDSCRIVSGSADKTLRVWDVKEGKALGQPFKGHENGVRSVVFSPDGKQIASGSYDKTICLWSAEEGQEFGSRLLILTGHEGEVYSVEFSSEGLHIISGSADTTVRIWDVQSGVQLRVLRGHRAQIRAITYSPVSRHIASGSEDRTIRIWDAETRQELRQDETLLDSEVFSRGDKHLVCFSTSWAHSLRDNCGSSLSSYMAAEVVEADDHGWTRFRQDKKSHLLFWAPQPYHPQWFDQRAVRRVPAPDIELDLSRMAHGSKWHLCYDSGILRHT
ncbi:hypothetical protein CVT26_002508 [Gymnopilus dilepis]|uniref:Nephrocystin 3-like N-terminal domain-containing protein n=1 Tax=Gymnopilus dilepis TaxID=231916 RepID=A0A409YN98_9AGAR|nr:hypothetical protein CVT26_002508 [Gymnopilus dilepis]